MRKLILTIVVLAVTFAAGTAQAGIFGRRNRAPVAQPAPVAAPAKTVKVENGYRAYSYQPAPVNAAPIIVARQSMTGTGFHDAGWKVRGF
jgi:hypothetical protein